MSFEQQRDRVSELAAGYTGDMTGFLRDMIAIPSESAGEREAIARAADEMRRVGFDEVKVDGLGNLLGRVGSGPVVVAIDGHIDTVGVGDPSTWTARSLPGRTARRRHLRARGVRPGSGNRGGRARGAHREGTRPARRRPALGDGYRDGRGLRRALLAVHPQGRRAEARGRRHHRADEPRRVSRPPRAHGDGGPHAGPLVPRVGPGARGQRRLQDGADRRRHRAAERAAEAETPTRSSARARSRSPRSAPRRPRCARWPTRCTIHLDRRLTRGETLEKAVAQVEALESVKQAGATVTVPRLRARVLHGPRLPDEEVLPDVGAGRDRTRRPRSGGSGHRGARPHARGGQVDVLHERHRDVRHVRRADGGLRAGQRGARAHARGPVPGGAPHPRRAVLRAVRAEYLAARLRP